MCDQRDMDDKEPRLLLGLPSEIIQNELFGYLRHKDIVWPEVKTGQVFGL